jgi:SAM-dependent methyltransferase
MTDRDNREFVRARLYGSYVSANKGLVPLAGRVGGEGHQRNLRYFRRRLEPWLEGVSRSASIADLGCGSGFLLDVLSGLGFSTLHGVDISAEQVQLAQARFPTVQQGDVFAFLKNSAGAFDVVFAFDLIEHLTRAEAIKFCDLVHCALRPGGRFIIQTPNGDAPLVGAVFNGDLTHETLFTPHSLRHLLRSCGFDVHGFQEHAPVPIDARSSVRWLAWRAVRSCYNLLHLAETGGTPSQIYSRVFRSLAQRP